MKLKNIFKRILCSMGGHTLGVILDVSHKENCNLRCYAWCPICYHSNKLTHESCDCENLRTAGGAADFIYLETPPGTAE